MSSVYGPGIHTTQLSDISLDRRDSVDDGMMESVDLSAREPRAGQGGLAGHTISVGDGQQRDMTLSSGQKAGNAFVAGLKTFGKILGGLIALPLIVAGAALVGTAKLISAIPKAINNHLIEPRSEKQFKLANEAMVKDLGTKPLPDGVLSKDGVVGKLVQHAKDRHTKVSEQEIREMVSTGEHIAKALQGPEGGKLPLKVTIDGQEHTVESNAYTARCVSWYMMAQAASQDVERERLSLGMPQTGPRESDMTTNGSFIMKDPGNRMYKFLSSAPTCASRMSTHFEERIGHGEKHKIGGLIQTGKPSQRGIEDYQGKMAGLGGTMLFDKLKPGEDGTGELFVKLESGGCPPYFQGEKNQGVGAGICRFFAALDRNIGHTFSFIGSKLSNEKGPNEVVRQEHVYKGRMKEVGQQFGELVQKAIGDGVISGDSSAIGKSVHKFGLPYVQDAIATIQEHARAQGNQAVLKQCSDLIDAIMEQSARFGEVSDRHGIERRGAESHISL